MNGELHTHIDKGIEWFLRLLSVIVISRDHKLNYAENLYQNPSRVGLQNPTVVLHYIVILVGSCLFLQQLLPEYFWQPPSKVTSCNAIESFPFLLFPTNLHALVISTPSGWCLPNTQTVFIAIFHVYVTTHPFICNWYFPCHAVYLPSKRILQSTYHCCSKKGQNH